MARAINCYEQALTLAYEIGDRRGERAALGHLDLAYRDLGNPARVRESLTQALPILEGIHSPDAAMIRGWVERLNP